MVTKGIKVGDRVRHWKYTLGEVLNIAEDGEHTIRIIGEGYPIKIFFTTAPYLRLDRASLVKKYLQFI